MLLKKVPVKGKLYITPGHICFSGSLMGRETRSILSVEDLIDLELIEGKSAIKITTTSDEYHLTLVHHLRQCYDMVAEMWAEQKEEFSVKQEQEEG